MDAGSPAASLWWTFWGSYLNAVFAPWWQAAKVPVSRDQGDLALTAGLFPLDEDLEAWTLGDPANPVFAGPPGGGSAARGASDHGASDHGASDHGASLPGASAHGLGSASAAIVAAFKKAVAHLSAKLGGAPATWTWGRPARTRYRPRTPALPGREYWAGAAAGRR